MESLSLVRSGNYFLLHHVMATLGVLMVFSGCQYILPPVKVGFVGSFSGEGASFGTHARRGFQMVFHREKLKYGNNGRRIEVLYRDDESDPGKALDIFRELDSQDCRLVVSFQTSESAKYAFRFAASRDIFIISGSSSSVEWDDRDDLIFRLVPSNYLQGQVLARAALKEGRRRVINVNSPSNPAYYDGFLEGFNQAFTSGGGTVAGSIDWSHGSDADLAKNKEKIISSGADSLGPVVLSSLDTSLLAHQIRELELPLGVYLSPWSLAEDLDQSSGRELEGFTAVGFTDPESVRAEFRQFLESYAAAYFRQPLFPAVLGFEAGQMMSFLISHGKDFQPEGIKKFFLDAQNLMGIQGPLLLDKMGDTRRLPIIYRHTQGRWQIIRS